MELLYTAVLQTYSAAIQVLLVLAMTSYAVRSCDFTEKEFHDLDRRLLKRQATERIPKILHHIYLGTSEFPRLSAEKAQQWDKCVQSCRNHSLDYTHLRWNNSMVLRLLETHYPWAVSLYNSYPYPIQRADASRLVIVVWCRVSSLYQRIMSPVIYTFTTCTRVRPSAHALWRPAFIVHHAHVHDTYTVWHSMGPHLHLMLMTLHLKQWGTCE